MWNQRACASPEEPVLWDYHVILLFNAKDDLEWQVYDLDTVLGAPISLNEYMISTFGNVSIPEEFRPYFRVIDAEEFARVFSSDRSHMLAADGQWQVPPPPWEAIVRDGRSNLMELINMQEHFIGTVMDRSQFEAAFLS